MNRGIHRRSAISLVCALVGTMVAGQGTAVAAEPSDAEAIASLVSTVGKEVAIAPTSRAKSVRGAVTIELPTGSGRRALLGTPGGAPISVGVPLEVQAKAPTVTADGSVVYVGHNGSAHAVLQRVGDSVRVATVISRPGGEGRFTYAADAGTHAQVNSDGSASIFRIVDVEDGVRVEVEVAEVAPPWAVAADGTRVHTEYEEGPNGELVQVLDLPQSSSAYPVVADPQYSVLNPFQARIRWNHAGTATIAEGGWRQALRWAEASAPQRRGRCASG